MLIIAPPPCSFICRAARCVHRKQPLRFVSITRSHSASSSSSSGFHVCTPALFTRMSRRGNSRRTCSNIRPTSPATPTLACTGNDFLPMPRISATVASAPLLSLLKLTAMSQPQRASSSAIPLPTPLLAPVTRAILDSRGNGMRKFYRDHRLQCRLDRVTLSAARQDAGKRLDHFLHEHLPAYSRARLQDWIKQGRVLVNGVER